MFGFINRGDKVIWLPLGNSNAYAMSVSLSSCHIQSHMDAESETYNNRFGSSFFLADPGNWVAVGTGTPSLSKGLVSCPQFPTPGLRALHDRRTVETLYFNQDGKEEQNVRGVKERKTGNNIKKVNERGEVSH